MSSEKVDEAVEKFNGNFNCCQAIILTYGPQFGLSEDSGIRLGTGFAGGLGRCGDVCGAVSGAIMVISLYSGMKTEDDIEAKDRTYELVKVFIDRFRVKNVFIDCKDLLECDLSTPEGRAQAQEEGLFSNLCPEFVKDAAEILEDIIH